MKRLIETASGNVIIERCDDAYQPPEDCDMATGLANGTYAWEAVVDTPPPADVRREILSVSQQALSSGFLHIIMFDLMQRYLAQAQAIVPTVTEADLLDANGPYYSKPYADTRAYYVQLVALQDAK